MKKTNAIDAELRQLLRRIKLLQGVAAGELKLRPITVHRKKKTWMVTARQMTYVRHIAPAGWKGKP